MDTVTGVGVLDKAIDILRVVADRPTTLGGLQVGYPPPTGDGPPSRRGARGARAAAA